MRSREEILAAIEHARRTRAGAKLTAEEKQYAVDNNLMKKTQNTTKRDEPITPAQRDLVEGSFEWVRRLVGKRLFKVPYDVDFDDLYQTAFVSVCQSAKRYDPTAGASFKTFASSRADFAITDYLREQGWGYKRHDDKATIRYELRSLDEPLDDSGRVIEIPVPPLQAEAETALATFQVVENSGHPFRCYLIEAFKGRTAFAMTLDHGVPLQTVRDRISACLKACSKEIREAILA